MVVTSGFIQEILDARLKFKPEAFEFTDNPILAGMARNIEFQVE